MKKYISMILTATLMMSTLITYIKNINAQKYLQVANSVGKAGQNVELSTGSGADGQKWYLKNVGNGFVTLYYTSS